MTPAERQQLKRDRAKASLVRLEFWVKQDKVDAITQAVDIITSTPTLAQSANPYTMQPTSIPRVAAKDPQEQVRSATRATGQRQPKPRE